MAYLKSHQLVAYLITQGIDDRQLLDVIAKVPRELFIPEVMRHQAYDNHALPIGNGQTISKPYTVAKMTQLLDLKPQDRVLEIGTGSGYQTAILAHLVNDIYSVERIQSLQDEAKLNLANLGIHHVHMRHADGWQGWQEAAPFDAIIVTAAAHEVPQALLAQLAEGGRLVLPVGKSEQHLYKIVKQQGQYHSHIIETVRFVPLVAGELDS